MDVELAAWALRNARTHAPDPTHRPQARVASAFDGTPAVHRAQVGRWESGRVAITYPLVRRYEVLLGYPEGAIQCLIDCLHRAAAPIRATATVPELGPVDVAATIGLIELALSEERMTGLDWYRLSGNLGRTPTAMLRTRDWKALLERCALEMAVSLDLEYALRDEALGRLAGHPQSGPVIAAMAAKLLRSPHAQVYSDTVELTMYCGHPDVVAVLLEQVRHPLNDDALRAALGALTSILRGGRASPEIVRETVRYALGFVRDVQRPPRIRRQSANLLRALNLPGKQRLAAGLSAHDLRDAATILLEGRSLDRSRLRTMTDRVRAALASDTHTHSQTHLDPVLERVVRTALEDTDDIARTAAVRVLMLAPQRSTVATALARDLDEHRARDDWDAVLEYLEVLVSLARAEDLDVVVDLLTDAQTRPDLALLSGIVVGNATDPDRARLSRRHDRIHQRAVHLIEDPVTALSGHDTHEQARQILKGLVYPLGIAGRFELIADLRRRLPALHAAPREQSRAGAAQVESPADVAPLATGVCDWWLSLPGHVRPGPMFATAQID
ncbi:hypothetical protein GCM10009868_40230 [Terrabacter aerolatus]|uniref:Uncharacterized protein n=1 Tax=Terrabacter aerolatus TaxID=422442 RepID=A0A512D729_9MICO|nr:hypothetical protein [Terrabacter aerolatus]GEO32177.1 hypothetical protein TAE01_39870 [Terrabacter aerolatus]